LLRRSFFISRPIKVEDALMQVTIDSAEPLERVLPVINALYGVSLSLPEPAAAASTATGPSRRSRSSKTAARQPSGRRSKRAAVPAGAVREWARSNGYEVSSRGRISAELLDAYRAAN
jgi:Lsr2 protein